MANAVVVETNWILDIALRRDEGSQGIWHLARGNRLVLFVPSLCLAESVKVLEGYHRGWGQIRDRLDKEARDIRRSDTFGATAGQLERTQIMLAELGDRLESAFWPILRDVTRRARLLEIGKDTVALAADIREFLKLSPADAIVLATAVLASRRGLCRCFVSRDKKAFNTEPTREYMKGEGIVYYAEPFAFLQDNREGDI